MIRILYLLLALLPLGGCLLSDYDIELQTPSVQRLTEGTYEWREGDGAAHRFSMTRRGTNYVYRALEKPNETLEAKIFRSVDPKTWILSFRKPEERYSLYLFARENSSNNSYSIFSFDRARLPPDLRTAIDSGSGDPRILKGESDTLRFLNTVAVRNLLTGNVVVTKVDEAPRPQASAAPFSDRPFCNGTTNRFALVIGNQTYEGALQALTNPRADATALTKVLCENGFTTFRYDDLKIAEFDRAIARFRTAAGNAETSFVYYSGHGFAMNGKNWLVPVDAGIDCDSLGSNADPSSLQRRLVDLSGSLLSSLPKSSNQIVVMDACRTDPVRSCFKGGAGPTMIRGLSAPGGSSGRLIVYATQDGKPALDGVAGSANSPLMTAMLQKFSAAPGANWLASMADVSREVARLTHNDQVPNLDISLPPDGCLARACAP